MRRRGKLTALHKTLNKRFGGVELTALDQDRRFAELRSALLRRDGERGVEIGEFVLVHETLLLRATLFHAGEAPFGAGEGGADGFAGDLDEDGIGVGRGEDAQGDPTALLQRNLKLQIAQDPVGLDLPAGDYFVWFSSGGSTTPFFYGATIELEEVAAVPEGESCVNPLDRTSATYTAPSAPGEPESWTLAMGSMTGYDVGVAAATEAGLIVPVVRNAELSEEQKKNPLLNIEVAEKAVLLDYALIGQMTSDWRERWDREVKTRMR